MLLTLMIVYIHCAAGTSAENSRAPAQSRTAVAQREQSRAGMELTREHDNDGGESCERNGQGSSGEEEGPGARTGIVATGRTAGGCAGGEFVRYCGAASRGRGARATRVGAVRCRRADFDWTD